jgi:hypothetical protein
LGHKHAPAAIQYAINDRDYYLIKGGIWREKEDIVAGGIANA